MLGDKKKSSRRLSSLFGSSGSSGSSEPSGSTDTKLSPTPTSSESSSRLTKVRNRLSSATHLTPEYPPPAAPTSPRQVSLSNPTIQPVEPANLEPLEPPPPLDVPSRASSPASSRPGTPSLDPSPEGKLKKLRRKSGLFGAPPNGIEGIGGAHSRTSSGNASPLAWIVGHKGKVPYNLTFLLNGEKVACCDSESTVMSVLTS
jgi:hypothetical protein